MLLVVTCVAQMWRDVADVDRLVTYIVGLVTWVGQYMLMWVGQYMLMLADNWVDHGCQDDEILCHKIKMLQTRCYEMSQDQDVTDKMLRDVTRSRCYRQDEIKMLQDQDVTRQDVTRCYKVKMLQTICYKTCYETSRRWACCHELVTISHSITGAYDATSETDRLPGCNSLTRGTGVNTNHLVGTIL